MPELAHVTGVLSVVQMVKPTVNISYIFTGTGWDLNIFHIGAYCGQNVCVRPGFHGQFTFDEDYFCHRNFGNEFVSTYIIILYYLARSPLSKIFDNETSPQNWIYTSIFSATNLLCQIKIVRRNEA